MNFIGVDLHKKLITVCVMNQNLKVTARKTLSCDQPYQIVEFFRQFAPFKAVIEATAILYAAISEASSNRWNFSVISDSRLSAWVVESPSMTSLMAA